MSYTVRCDKKVTVPGGTGMDKTWAGYIACDRIGRSESTKAMRLSPVINDSTVCLFPHGQPWCSSEGLR